MKKMGAVSWDLEPESKFGTLLINTDRRLINIMTMWKNLES